MSASRSTVFGACPHDCPDGCAMLYTVEDDRLVKVKGNPDQPFTNGRLCVKVKDYEKHHYNPDRLHYPLRRDGPKGMGKFKPVSWDEALGEIKSRWDGIIAEHGAKAILPYGYAGNMGLLNGMNAGDAFFNKLGTSIGEKSFCASSLVTAQLMTIGPTLGTDPESIVHARFIIVWGANTISTNSHLWPFILRAKKQGAKLVVIDPWRSRTAAQADKHIQIRPGTDGALALALMHTIIAEGLLDHDYVEQYLLGFEEMRDRADGYTAERVAEITGISAADVRQLARDYATIQPSVIRVGVGLERYPGGGQAIRIIDCLPALVGAWRFVGGGLLQMPIFVPVRFDLLSRPEWIGPAPRVINLATLAEVLSQDTDLEPPVKSLFIWNANPLSQAPDANGVKSGLIREDIFTVVSEQFMTDTAHYADLVLPATMEAEHNDILTSWGHFYITLNEKAIDAPGEAISNFELFQRLGRCFGFDDARFTQTDLELLAESLDWDSPMLAGHSFKTLREKGFIRVQVPRAAECAPHAEGNFPTSSGKCEFRSSIGEQAGYVGGVLRQLLEGTQNGASISAVPDYIPNRQGNNAENTWPLMMNSPKSHGFLNSEYANEEHKIKGQGEQSVLINPIDAVTRNVNEGDKVKVFNDKGEFYASAKITEDVLPGNIVASFGYWASGNPLGGAVNALTENKWPGFAGTPAYYDTGVEVACLE